MSGFTENRASGASEQSGSHDRVMTWHASRTMLPLVGRIAGDVVQYHEQLTRMQPEFAHLERNRRTLSWPDRARRYQLEEDIASAQNEMRTLLAELEVLGLTLLEPALGLIGFPTLVNDRRAFFSWRPGETSVLFWNYADDLTRHPVPEDWTEVPSERPARGRSRPRKK
jgi:hypothetical protein